MSYKLESSTRIMCKVTKSTDSNYVSYKLSLKGC